MASKPVVPGDLSDIAVQAVVDRIERYSEQKGWVEDFRTYERLGNEGWRIQAALIAEKLALVGTEVAEAVEELRRATSLEELRINWLANDGKPEGFGSELADIHIRVWNLERMVGLDPVKNLVEKLNFNDTREYKHGGKTL